MNAMSLNLIFDVLALSLCGAAVWTGHTSYWGAVGSFCGIAILFSLITAAVSGLDKTEKQEKDE